MHFHENILKQISNSTKRHHLTLEFRFSSVQAQVVQVHFRSGPIPKNQDLNGKSGQNIPPLYKKLKGPDYLKTGKVSF